MYLTSLTPSYVPQQAQGTWYLPPATQALWSPTKGGSFSNALRLEGVDGTADMGLLWAISEPITSADFPAGCMVNWGIEALQESIDSGLYWHIHVYVLAGSTDAIRCTLLEDYREDDASNNEWPVNLVGAGPQPGPPLLSPCIAPPQLGDRLAIEIGFVARNAMNEPHFGFVNYGTTDVDVVIGESGGAAWVDLIGATVTF